MEAFASASVSSAASSPECASEFHLQNVCTSPPSLQDSQREKFWRVTNLTATLHGKVQDGLVRGRKHEKNTFCSGGCLKDAPPKYEPVWPGALPDQRMIDVLQSSRPAAISQSCRLVAFFFFEPLAALTHGTNCGWKKKMKQKKKKLLFCVKRCSFKWSVE